MSVRERFSLEFVSATGQAAYQGSKKDAGFDALPDLFLLEEGESASEPREIVSAADESVEELRSLFDSVR